MYIFVHEGVDRRYREFTAKILNLDRRLRKFRGDYNYTELIIVFIQDTEASPYIPGPLVF